MTHSIFLAFLYDLYLSLGSEAPTARPHRIIDIIDTNVPLIILGVHGNFFGGGWIFCTTKCFQSYTKAIKNANSRLRCFIRALLVLLKC